MEIKTIFSGPCDNNTYLICDDKNAILIDASCSVDKINTELNGRKLQAVFITHGHYDHIANLDEIVEEFGVKVYLTKQCFDKLNNKKTNCSDVFDMEYETRLTSSDFVFVKTDDSLDFIEDYPITVYITEGHTDCGVCLKLGKDILFSGDTIFYRSYGRTDLPTGSSQKLRESLKFINETFKNFTIYPGHGRKFVL